MTSCVVKWCRKCKERRKSDTGITFHCFPKNELRRMLWTKAVRLERRQEDWAPNKFSRVCSIHFDAQDMYLSSKGNRMLKKSAVPICTPEEGQEGVSTINISENIKAHKHKAMVKCPNCTYEFDIQANEYSVAEKKQKPNAHIIDMPSCSTPISVPSSEIDSVLIFIIALLPYAKYALGRGVADTCPLNLT